MGENTMARRPRRTHSPAFKAMVVLAAIKGEETPAELVQQYDVHANQITNWTAQLIAGASARVEVAPIVDLKLLHAEIGGRRRWRTIFCLVHSARPVC